MAEKRGTMDSLVSKYIVERQGSEDGQKWLNWQREAEAELEKSRMAWADTAASRAALESESTDRLSTLRFFELTWNIFRQKSFNRPRISRMSPVSFRFHDT